MAGRECPGCGARVKSVDARFCEYCGAAMPEPEPVAPIAPSRYGDLGSRFRALDSHPGLGELMAYAPSGASTMLGYAFLILFGFIFGGIGFAVFLGFASGPGGAVALFPLLFVLIGVGISIGGLVKIVRFSNAPLRREPACVTGERTQVSGGGRNRSASTSYYVTLEFPDGRRHEYRTKGSVVGEVSEGDLGMAYLRGGYLLDFRRVRV